MFCCCTEFWVLCKSNGGLIDDLKRSYCFQLVQFNEQHLDPDDFSCILTGSYNLSVGNIYGDRRLTLTHLSDVLPVIEHRMPEIDRPLLKVATVVCITETIKMTSTMVIVGKTKVHVAKNCLNPEYNTVCWILNISDCHADSVCNAKSSTLGEEHRCCDSLPVWEQCCLVFLPHHCLQQMSREASLADNDLAILATFNFQSTKLWCWLRSWILSEKLKFSF